jgi:hypothetical protein
MTPQGLSGSIDLFWIPLGVRGSGFVRFVGKVYESLMAHRDDRVPLALYHAALRVHTADGPFAVEMVLPSRGGDPASRGVVLEGAVGSPWLGWARLFRYEVRRWRNGILLDDEPAAVGPLRLSDDPDRARRLLESTHLVPPLVWGRDQLGAGEMWNSNSMISWLLAKAGLPVEAIRAPVGARAPGWDAGIVLARTGAGEGRSLGDPTGE